VAHKARINFVSSQVRFLTLTIRPRESLPEALLHINQAWNRLRLKVTRKVGKVKYLKVIEPHGAQNMPHFHVLLDKYLPAAWMNQAVVQAGFGPIWKIKFVRNDQIYAYITKYLTKGITSDSFLSALLLLRSRRYSFSQHLIPYSASTRLHPVSIHETGDRPLLASLLHLRWIEISISSGYYPLKIDDNIVLFFKRADVPLLPAPPTSGASGPPTPNVRA